MRRQFYYYHNYFLYLLELNEIKINIFKALYSASKIFLLNAINLLC